MDIGKVFPGRYIKVGDLDGRDVVVVIKDVKLESVGQGQQSKPVAYFRGTDKGLVLNVTNSKRIAAIAGSNNTDDWRGTKITLYGTETEFQGDVVECIRVRVQKREAPPILETIAKKRRKPRSTEPEPDDPIPPPAEPTEPVDDAVTFDTDDLEDPFSGA